MLQGIITAILLISFIAGIAWAYSGKRRQEFDEAAQLPLEDVALEKSTENAP